jgi:hypothetical protein
LDADNFQSPNPKSQIQTPDFTVERLSGLGYGLWALGFWAFGLLGFWAFGLWGFGDFGLWGFWDLGFGIWDL